MCFHGNDVLCFVTLFFFFGQNLYDLVHLQEGCLGFRVVKVLEVVFLPKCRMYHLGYFSSFFGGRGLIFINSLRSLLYASHFTTIVSFDKTEQFRRSFKFPCFIGEATEI